MEAHHHGVTDAAGHTRTDAGARHRGRTSGERGVRPTAVEEAAEIGAPRGRSRGYVAADERRGGGVDTAAGYRVIQDNLGSSKLRVDVVSCSMFYIFFQELKYV